MTLLLQYWLVSSGDLLFCAGSLNRCQLTLVGNQLKIEVFCFHFSLMLTIEHINVFIFIFNIYIALVFKLVLILKTSWSSISILVQFFQYLLQ